MSKRVVILIFAHKPQLEWYEDISLRQCGKVLGRHLIRLVCPEGLDVSAYRSRVPALEVDFIPAHWLSSVRSYNRLKILPFLYERYSAYEFMLTYELDAFVFRDDLEDWCEQGWDFIGAPWFEGHGNAGPTSPPIAGVNSGFSLRRINSMLKVMRTWKNIRPAREVIAEWKQGARRSPRAFWWLLRNLTWRNCFHHLVNGFTDNEDIFWTAAGARIDGFRLAPYKVAARFSFECNPVRLFVENQKTLPFGCHKWFAIQPDFWKPFIQGEGYRWPD